MNSSGEIRNLLASTLPKENEMALSREQAFELKRKSTKKRKNWMRNQPCKCGSGRKTKHCCWYKMTKIYKDELRMEAKNNEN